jgi:hypothetical protein
MDEQRHGDLFRERAKAILSSFPRRQSPFDARWLGEGERGLDDVVVEKHADAALLAFLHLSERDAARQFAVYCDVLGRDPETQALFTGILRDEVFHMTYSRSQLERVSQSGYRFRLWLARGQRFWRGYLRLAGAIAGTIGSLVLAVQYFVILPPFALAAKRAARRQGASDRLESGWTSRTGAPRSLRTQY